MRKNKTTKRIFSGKKPEKSLLRPMKKKAGRNKDGRITARHRGGGAKRRYRVVEFGQKNLDIKAKVKAIEYDPNRTAHIALLEFENSQKAYILAPYGLKQGQEVVCSAKAPLAVGNRMMLKNIAVGSFAHNIELTPGAGGRIARTAGASAQIMAHEGGYTNLKMPSSEIRKVPSDCFASIGALSNPEHRFRKLGKAGISRLKGRRPTVRGSAMNPVDHPHGGGEGRAGIGMSHPKTPWGKPALGVKTRKKKWTDKLIVQRRKKKK